MSHYIIAAVEDMFFASKIRATALQLDQQVRFIKDASALIAAARQELPACIIADLHSTRLDPFALARQLKEDEQLRHIPLIGFFSHVQTELQRHAQNAGYDRVLPRSAFTKQLPLILQSKQT